MSADQRRLLLQSPAYREARRRARLMARARTPLGHYWHQKQLVAALKALLSEPRHG